MERLTLRITGGQIVCEASDHCDNTCDKCLHFDRILKKLAKYEDLEEQCGKDNYFGLHTLYEKWKAFQEDIVELLNYRKKQEQGLLLELPCPRGTKVYFLNYEENDDFGEYTICSGIFHYSWLDFPRKFYLTRFEAEEALARMKGE